MKRLFLVAALVTGSITLPPLQAKVCELCPSDNFDKLITDNAKVVVDFYAPWCGHCITMKPHFEALGKMAEMNGILFITVNTEDFPELANKFGVRNIPHLTFFKNGKVIATEHGGKSKTELTKLVKSKLS